MRRLLPWTLLALFACAPDRSIEGGSTSSMTRPAGLYLKGAVVFPSAGRRVLRDRAVIVRGQTIDAIVPADAPIPADLSVVDLGGKMLLPGLIDSHTHLTIRERDYASAFRKLLAAGVTTVRDLTGDPRVQGELRGKVEAGEMVGPRIFYAGPVFTQPGGYPMNPNWTDLSADFVAAASRGVSSAASARTAVREVASSGVDLIKVAVEDCQGSCPRISNEVLEAVVIEAHAAGLRVVAHAQSSDNVADAITAGVDGIEHGEVENAISTDTRHTVTNMATKGIFLDSTFTRLSSWGPTTMTANVRAFREAGVKLTVGTDADGTHVAWGVLPNELEELVRAGATPSEALTAATSTAAEYLGHSDLIGTIEPGKRADLIAVHGDPTSKISDIRNVDLVLRDGVVVHPAD